MIKKEYCELSDYFPVCIHYIALSRRVNHAKSKKIITTMHLCCIVNLYLCK